MGTEFKPKYIPDSQIEKHQFVDPDAAWEVDEIIDDPLDDDFECEWINPTILRVGNRAFNMGLVERVDLNQPHQALFHFGSGEKIIFVNPQVVERIRTKLGFSVKLQNKTRS